MAHVWHYDGTSGVRHEAELIPSAGGFHLRFDDGDGQLFRWNTLVARGVRNGSHVFGIPEFAGWQIGFADGIPPELAHLLPAERRYGGWIDRFGVLRVGAAFAAVSAVVLAIGLKAPDWIAPNIPMSFEQRLGSAMVGDLSGRFCKGAGGQAALDALVRRIEPSGAIRQVHVVHVEMVNAVTLPGGTILIFDGLLRQANSADELAGVIGHEMGHVRHRDVMQALVRQAGLSVLLGGFSGNVGGNMNALLSASYSRTAESGADDYAIAALRQAKVAPKDTAALFTRLGKDEGRVGMAFAYMSSHPVSAERASRFAKSSVPGTAYTPALTPEQWSALADICHNDPARQKDNPFDILG